MSAARVSVRDLEMRATRPHHGAASAAQTQGIPAAESVLHRELWQRRGLWATVPLRDTRGIHSTTERHQGVLTADHGFSLDSGPILYGELR